MENIALDDARKQIAELEAKIKEAKKANKVKGVPVIRTSFKAPKTSSGVTMMTPSIREAKAAAEAEELQRKLAKIADSPLADTITSSEVVDAHMGGLSDLPDLA